jgi:hypothetical protein
MHNSVLTAANDIAVDAAIAAAADDDDESHSHVFAVTTLESIQSNRIDVAIPKILTNLRITSV